MTFEELRAIAKVKQEGWIVYWTSKGWVISMGLDPAMQLTAARGGKRYIKNLNAAGNIMSSKIGVETYTVYGRPIARHDDKRRQTD